MIEPPAIAPAAILAAVEAGWPVRARALEFLPIGYDASAWVFRLDVASSAPLFAKLKRGAVREPVLHATSRLHAQVGAGIVAPLPTRSGACWAPVDADHHLILHPWIDGTNGGRDGMAPADWMALGRLLARLHASDAGMTSGLPVETFRSSRTALLARVRRSIAAIDAGAAADPLGAQLAAAWHRHAGAIERCVRRTRELGDALRRRGLPQVVCHADCHPFNVLVRPDGDVALVDWDEMIIAPRERDLFFIESAAAAGFGAAADPGAAGAFSAGYLGYDGCDGDGDGGAGADADALAYYRHEWAVQEFAEFGAMVLLRPDLGDATRADAVAQFEALFAADGVVERACSADPQSMSG